MDSPPDLRPRQSQEATNEPGVQSFPKEKIANMDREVYRIRMDLTSRECELKYSKAAEAHLRSQLQQLTEDNSSLRHRLLRQEEQRIAAEIDHDAQLKESLLQVDQLRDNLRTEFSKTALLERQLNERTTRLTAAQKLLDESENSRKKWMEHHISQSGRQEAVIGALNEHTQKLLEDQLQLEAEAAEATKEREEVQRVYVDELQKLQDGNAKLQSELREKDGQVAELSRQLRNAQGQLMQYSNAPNGQFKLTSELYASLVASEDKVAALEEENARLKVLQKQSLQTVQTFGEELTEVRNSAMETAQVLRKAEKLIVRLKRESGGAEKTVSSDRSRSLPESDNMAATERELQLYREQAEDDQKRNFFSLIAHAPARYDEVMTVARDQAVLWAFVAEHGAEAQVRQVESLKNAITVLQQAKRDLQTQNVQLSTSLKDGQNLSNSEIEGLRAQLREADESICSLTGQCYELSQDRATLASQQCRLEDELKEAKAKVEEADKARRHLLEALDKEKMAVMQQSSEMSQLRSLLVEVTSQKELLSMKEQTLRGEIQHLENVIETLSAQQAKADIVYWVSESQRIQSQLEGDRLLLQQASTKLASLDKLDRLQADNQALQQRLSSLQAEISGPPTTKPTADADMEMIANLTSRARLALESQAHEAALASLQEARAEVATLQLTLGQHEKQEQQWKKTITSLKSQAAAREKTWREEVRLLTEQMNNHQSWMDSTLAGRQQSQDQGSVLWHMVRHSALLQQRLKVAQEELAMLRTLEEERVADNVGAGRILPEEQSKDVWQSMYQRKSSLLSSMVEYSATLRSEVSTLHQTVKELGTKGQEMSGQIEVLESQVESLRAERQELSQERRRLEGELTASIQRFETGAHKAQLEKLQKEKVELEKKRRSDLENQKEHYRKQFEDMRKKNVDTLNSKRQEAEAVKEELEALQKVHSGCGTTEQTLREEMRSMETQLAARERICLQAVEECNQARLELAEARDGHSRLRAEVQSSQAKEKQLLEQLNAMMQSGDRTDGAAASASASASAGARIRLRPASSLVSGGVRSSTAPASNLSLDGSGSAAASGSALHAAPLDTMQSPMASAHPSMETSCSTASTSAAPPSLPSAKRSHLPSTSDQSHCKDSADSQEPFKRLRRDVYANPTSSDVISSTNSSLAQRTRINSRSGGAAETAAVNRPRTDCRAAPIDEERQAVAQQQPIQSPKVGTDGATGDVQGQEVALDMEDEEEQPSPDDQMEVNDELEAEGPDEGEDVEQEDVALDDGQQLGQLAPDNDEEAAEKDVEDSVTQSSEGAVSPSGELSDQLSETADQAEGGMYDVTPREDEESSSGSYDEDDGNASYPTSSSFQFTCPAQAAVHEGPEQARASEGGALQPEPSTSTGRSRPSLTPLDRPSLSHSPRSSAPAHSSGTSAIPSSSLGLPPRTPGVSVLSGRYESGPDEYGVVPSTPKLITPRREEEGNAMPHVPHFFGEMSEAIEDVTASQVPPTPHNTRGQFFEDALNAASEDSSSFQGPEDSAAPSLPSVSVEMAGEVTDNVPTSQADEQPAYVSPRRPTRRSQVPQPMVPSPEEASVASTDNDRLPSGSGQATSRLSPSAGRPARRPAGPRAGRAGRGALRLSPGLLSSPERRPIMAPVVASTDSATDQVPLMPRAVAPRGAARGATAAGRSAATRGRRRRRSNLM